MLRGFRDLFRSEPSEEVRPREKEKQTIKSREWMQSIRQEESPQIKMHVYNFFITEGHYDLATTFAKEAGLKSNGELK